MKRVFFMTLVLGLALSAAAQNSSADRARWINEYLSFEGLAFWGNPETGKQENILWVYNFSDVTFEVRAVFPDVALDTTFLVTQEGNKRGFYGETWIYTGFRVPFQNPPVIRGRLYARSLDADRPINFTLTRSWYGHGR